MSQKSVLRYAMRGAAIMMVAPYQVETVNKIGFKKLGVLPHPLDDSFLGVSAEEKERASLSLKTEYACDIALFSSTRHVWHPRYLGLPDYKGNDLVIRAYARYVQQCRGKKQKPKLFLIEKGPDVADSKTLIRQLEIENEVVWLAEIPRDKLLKFYAGADLFFDQFSIGCLATSAVEAMACGTPTLSYIGNPADVKTPFYKTWPPVINVRDEEGIFREMTRILGDSSLRARLQIDGAEWVRTECSWQKMRDDLYHLLVQSKGAQ